VLNAARVADLFARLPGGRDVAIRWSVPFGDDLGRAWAECPRGDWLLWLAATLGLDAPTVALATADCARFSLSLLPLADHEASLREPLALVERWAREEIADAVCTAAARDLLSLYEQPDGKSAEGPATAGYATASVSAALMVPGYRSGLGLACGAAAAALKAAQVAAPGDEGAIDDAHHKCADLVRERIPFSVLAELPAFMRFAAGAGRGA
jgi:hypothetical protein